MREMFRVLIKFLPAKCYTQQRLGKQNVVPQKVDKVDKEFECEKKLSHSPKDKKLVTK